VELEEKFDMQIRKIIYDFLALEENNMLSNTKAQDIKSIIDFMYNEKFKDELLRRLDSAIRFRDNILKSLTKNISYNFDRIETLKGENNGVINENNYESIKNSTNLLWGFINKLNDPTNNDKYKDKLFIIIKELEDYEGEKFRSNDSEKSIEDCKNFFKEIKLDDDAYENENTFNKKIKKILLKYHPDKNSSENANEITRKINICKDIIKNKIFNG
jgi:hypothetical protein